MARRATPSHTRARSALRKAALAYPETTEEFPWGERVIKVRGRVFLFLGSGGPDLGLSVKLPISGTPALDLPFVRPSGYGLGKSGWCSARIPAGEPAPVALLLEWLDESYRAIAPKALVRSLCLEPARGKRDPQRRRTEAPASLRRMPGRDPRG